MIQNSRQGGQASPVVVPVQNADFSVSWAGQGRRDNEFCFGSEDGKLAFTNLEGEPIGRICIPDNKSEAVNGVAFIGDSATAVSSRDEVIISNVDPTDEQKNRVALLPCGAHGIVATGDGQFVASLGIAGLLRVMPDQEEEQPFFVTRSLNQTLNYYEVIDLSSSGWPGVLVCAVRSGGVATIFSEAGDQEHVRTISSPELDVVDVCSLGSRNPSPAVVAVGRDGTLIFIKDVLRDREAMTVNFDVVSGVAYRVFCFQGSVLLLTSKGLLVFNGLAGRFMVGDLEDTVSIQAGFVSLEAVDASLCWEKWLLVVLPDQVLRYDVNLLIGDATTDEDFDKARTVIPTVSHRAWNLQNEATELAAV